MSTSINPGCTCVVCQPRPTDAQPVADGEPSVASYRERIAELEQTIEGMSAFLPTLKELREGSTPVTSFDDIRFGAHDGPCDIERVEPGWNVQSDSGEVFVSDAEIVEMREAIDDGGDIQAARLIAERYSAAYADGFSAGVELGESRAAAAAPVEPAAPDLAPGIEFALEVVRRFAMVPRGQQVAFTIGLQAAAQQRGVVLGAKAEP